MHERFSIGPGHSADLFGTESLFVEFNSFAGSFHDQVWCQCMEATGNWFDSADHVFSFHSLSLVRKRSLPCAVDFHGLGVALGWVVHFEDVLVAAKDAIDLRCCFVLLPGHSASVVASEGKNFAVCLGIAL